MRLLLSTAIVALSAGASFAQDLTSSNSTISVSGGTVAGSPVSFGNRGIVTNNGFGTGSLSSSISEARYGAAGYAFMRPAAGADTTATSGSGAMVESTFTRAVDTSATMIGAGNISSVGTAQNSFSGDVEAESAGTINSIVGGTDLFRSAASTNGSAGLSGNGLTSSGVQLAGATPGFVATASNEVAGTQRAAALGANNTEGDGGSAQAITPFLQAGITAGSLGNLTAAQTSPVGGTAGLVFVFDDSNGSVMNLGADPAGGSITGINITAPNLGGGTVTVEGITNGTTSGFFGAGGTTSYGEITP